MTLSLSLSPPFSPIMNNTYAHTHTHIHTHTHTHTCEWGSFFAVNLFGVLGCTEGEFLGGGKEKEKEGHRGEEGKEEGLKKEEGRTKGRGRRKRQRGVGEGIKRWRQKRRRKKRVSQGGEIGNTNSCPIFATKQVHASNCLNHC